MRTNTRHPLNKAARQIQKRLITLLVKAFGAVVLVIAILLGVFALWFFNVGQREVDPSLMTLLEAYYYTEGNWHNPADIPDYLNDIYGEDTPVGFSRFVLLDESERIILDNGQSDTDRIGQAYDFRLGELRFTLQMNDEAIGTVIFERSPLVAVALSTGLLLWIAFLSLLPALLTILVAFLLSRRIIPPLAEVMAAAHSVSQGNLASRVTVRGPAELQDLIDSFNQMAHSIEVNDKERRDMLADIAHELRTPLSIIRGRVEGIIDRVYPVEETQLVPILEEVYLLERLVSDLRLLTLAEAKELPLDLHPVNPVPLVKHTILLFEAATIEKQVTIDLHTTDSIPAVYADPQRTTQIITNLLNNALMHVPQEGRIQVDITPEENAIRIAISDSGPGLPQDDLPYIFERFWRHDRARSRLRGGAGLGLAIARQLTVIQQGTIEASIGPLGGLQVAFTLPTG